MGFPLDDIESALLMSHNNPETALELLTSGFISSDCIAETKTLRVSDLVLAASLVRQASGNSLELCSICQDETKLVGSSGILDIRIGCSCMYHYECLVTYIKVTLGDKEAL